MSDTDFDTGDDTTALCHCPEQYPAWDEQEVDLGRHCVHTMSIPTFVHMPIALELYRQKQHDEIQNHELAEPWPDFALIRTGMFGGKIMRLLNDVTSPSRHVSFLPRPFQVRGKLHHGDIGTVRLSLGEMQMGMVERGCRPKELYLGYLTCPRCEERKGGPKILLVRRWEESAGLKKRQKSDSPGN